MSPLVAKQSFRFSTCVALMLFASACSQGVREDRRAEFSRDGGRVAFQHGNEGVFVASADGQGLTKIFEPDPSVLATSRPLSNPVDGRIIFTTAKPLQDEKPPAVIRERPPTPAEGQIVWQQPVRYTCWLRTEPKDDQPAVVKKLFDATCGHVGYVSAGLAVRWNPDGQQILHVAAVENQLAKHSVFAFDPTTETSRQIFPHAADAVIFDWSPGGAHLVCVTCDWEKILVEETAQDRRDGIWIGTPGDDGSWWKVPDSERLAVGELNSMIEDLRASRPAWTKDDSRFAFVVQNSSKEADQKVTHALRQVDVASRAISTITRVEGNVVDLDWSPDGKQLGFVAAGVTGKATLNVADAEGRITLLPTSDSIRKFAGFDSTGRRLAYVVNDRIESLPAKWWAFLFLPDQRRCRVRMAAADAASEGHEIFSGMQVTFPQWSPTEEKLSLWLTFVPRYQSLISAFTHIGLRPGDPAATIDTQTGTISWMAVSPQEELQIGHYYLLKGDAEEAWRWYAKARQKLPASQPPADIEQFLNRVGAAENSELFEYLCLRRLGRDAEATARWFEFERNFFPLPPAPPKPGEPIRPVSPTAAIFEAVKDTTLLSLIHDLYVAEVFLSVNGLESSIDHFRKPPGAIGTDDADFSRAVVLSQLLLIAGDHSAYLTQCTEQVIPLAMKVWQSQKPKEQEEIRNLHLTLSTGLCLVPLFCPDFLEQFPEETVRQQTAAWNKLLAHQSSNLPAVALDLMLRAAAIRLHDDPEVQRLDDRLAANPEARKLFGDRPTDAVIESWKPHFTQ